MEKTNMQTQFGMKKNSGEIEGGNAVTYFEYGFENNMYTHIAVENGVLKCRGSKVTHAVFRNYPVLQIDDLWLEDCAFENCNTICLTDCKANNCQFENIQTIHAVRSPISGGDFINLRCDNDCVICLEDSDVSFCSFKNVELRNRSYLATGVGDVWLESCSFENIRTDREDRELFFCEEIVGKIFKKKVRLNIVDEDSCKGLRDVQFTATTGDTVVDGKLQVWMQADEKGLLTPAALDAMREGISFDETRWDTQKLGISLEPMIISVRVFNCLTRAGLRTVGDVVRLDIMQILQIRNVGKIVIREVVQMLHSLDITGSAWDYLV